MNTFSEEEKLLYQLLDLSLHPDKRIKIDDTVDFSWDEVISMAEKHGVLALLHDVLARLERFSEECMKYVEKKSQQNVMQQYRLLFLSRYLLELLKKNGIRACLLKGSAAAFYYPQPELRKSGDIDIVLQDINKLEVARALLEKCGFQLEDDQLANHHLTFVSKEGIAIELHSMFAEPFDNKKLNAYMEEVLQECETEYVNVMGANLRTLKRPFFAFHLLLHMMQHFLRSGFGLKLLCDWVLFWQEPTTQEDRECYLRLVKDAGIKGFSDVITNVCVMYLGLEQQDVAWMELSADSPVVEFMREILDAEEFGKSGETRMVMMRGTGFIDYVREFHHQMNLNFPKAGKCFLFWPVLWVITMVKFLYNNRKVRNISTKEILKEAKRRSKLMEKIKI